MKTMEDASALIDKAIQTALERASIDLADGRTPQELAAALARYDADLAIWKVDALASAKRFALDPRAHGSVQ
ncbi:hypothetical protein D3227_27275 [Mesorhizobium waimense]|uniref:Uncharacterized protein n=1 Tax=Mesorhizobium waimense TaxID=1300307 RepID=A0A3A5KHS9_9HYPH|nr:hypothetical protein [Mesorhizobium waimense]RJT32105.1 hypothetical protein D3227_27275 [Mesorhizobium waimense]